MAEIVEASSSDLDDVEVNELVRVHARIYRKLEFLGLVTAGIRTHLTRTNNPTTLSAVSENL